MRIESCIHYCMEQSIQEGHLYADKQEFQKKVYEQLNYGYAGEAVTEKEVYAGIYKLFSEKKLQYEDGALYPAKTYRYECKAAEKLASLLMEEEKGHIHTDALIEDAQKELGITLSAKQTEAVKKAFSHKVSIITGGPGTGKTTVQRVLLYIHEKTKGGAVLLTAPTGRASRRMVESTGFSAAHTMHSVLGLTNDEDSEGSGEMLAADFIIADEFSMADMALSSIRKRKGQERSRQEAGHSGRATVLCTQETETASATATSDLSGTFIRMRMMWNLRGWNFQMEGSWSITAMSWIWWSIPMPLPSTRARAVSIR